MKIRAKMSRSLIAVLGVFLILGGCSSSTPLAHQATNTGAEHADVSTPAIVLTSEDHTVLRVPEALPPNPPAQPGPAPKPEPLKTEIVAQPIKEIPPPPKTETAQTRHFDQRGVSNGSGSAAQGARYPWLKVGQLGPIIFPYTLRDRTSYVRYRKGKHLAFEKGRHSGESFPIPHSAEISERPASISSTVVRNKQLVVGNTLLPQLPWLSAVHCFYIPDTARKSAPEDFFILKFNPQNNPANATFNYLDWREIATQSATWDAFLFRKNFDQFANQRETKLSFKVGPRGQTLELKIKGIKLPAISINDTIPSPLDQVFKNGIRLRIYPVLPDSTSKNAALVGIVTPARGGNEIWFFALPSAAGRKPSVS